MRTLIPHRFKTLRHPVDLMPNTSSPYSVPYSGFDAFSRSEDPADMELDYGEHCLTGEQHAIALFEPPLPTEPKACVDFIRDCQAFLYRFGDYMHIYTPHPTDLLQHREMFQARCHHLESFASSTTSAEWAQTCAREARSLVASMVFRFGYPKGALHPKEDLACPPGNVVEMLSWLARSNERERASEIELSDPDAMPKARALFEKACKPPDGWRASPDDFDAETSPTPDTLIEAARQKRPFDELRRRAWVRDYYF